MDKIKRSKVKIEFLERLEFKVGDALVLDLELRKKQKIKDSGFLITTLEVRILDITYDDEKVKCEIIKEMEVK